MADGLSTYDRESDDWYVEPRWSVDLLLDHVDFSPGAYDPACGLGTIPEALKARGLESAGSDITDRSQGRYRVRDFLGPVSRPDWWPNIITNPPYAKCVQFIERGLHELRPGGRMALLVPLKFLASQQRYELLSGAETEQVLVLSKRPSIPPGRLLVEKGEAVRRGGSVDFCWLVFRKGGSGSGPPSILWLKGKKGNLPH